MHIVKPVNAPHAGGSYDAALDRLQATLATLRGSGMNRIGLTTPACTDTILGAIVLERQHTRLTVDVMPEPHQDGTLRLNLRRMDTAAHHQKEGHGSQQLLHLFDIADASGIERIDLTCAEIGRYAHAANHARAVMDGTNWSGLQDKLKQILSEYRRKPNLNPRHREIRREQAMRLDDVIDTCEGRLQKIVAAGSAKTIGCRFDTTLAKLLFLDHRIKTYQACWLPEDRAAFRTKMRARYGIGVEPANSNEQLVITRPTSARRERLKTFSLNLR